MLGAGFADYAWDYRLFAYIMTGDRDVRDLLVADYHVEQRVDGCLEPVGGVVPPAYPEGPSAMPPVDALGHFVPLDSEVRVPWALDLQEALENLADGLAAGSNDILVGGHGVSQYDDPRKPGADRSFVTFADLVGQLEAATGG